MKKFVKFLIIAVIATLAFGCNQKEKKEIARLNLENQTLRQETHMKDSSINSIMLSLNDIEGNLSEIKEKESMIAVKSSGKDISPDVRARINDDVKVINELMSKNKREISWLRKKMKDSNLKIAELEKMINQLNEQINERDQQIASLKQDLAKLNFSVATLNASLDTMKTENNEMKTTLQNKTTALNTAYYVTGNKKELLSENVITKEGGFIGINSVTRLKPDFDNASFKKINITETREIALNSKKAKLVTTHPAGSYELTPDDKGIYEKLEITNPEKFWSTSKYLVVLTN